MTPAATEALTAELTQTYADGVRWGRANPADGGGFEGEEFAYIETEHPRDDKGEWVLKGQIAAAKTDPRKADALRARTTKPAERAKLEKLLAKTAPGIGRTPSFLPPPPPPTKIPPGVTGTGTKQDPYHCKADIALAAKLLAEGKHIHLEQPEQVATLVDQLYNLVTKAKAQGAAAPAIDLCKVSATGTNLFCQETKGIPRANMPQMRGTAVPGSYASTKPTNKAGKVDVSAEFLKHLHDKGVAVQQTSVRASHLRASQAEIDGGRVVELIHEAEAGTKDLRKRPIFVTKDNYVLDGHHHWAALVGVGYGKDKDLKVPVYKLDMEIGEAITAANDFANAAGIAPKSVPGAAGATGKFTDHPPGGMHPDGQYKPFAQPTPADDEPVPLKNAGPAPDLFALAGPTGKKATDLIRAAMLQGAKTYADIARPAIGRLAVDPHWRTAPTLFTPAELDTLAGALAAVTTPADLLARSSVLRKVELAGAHHFFEGPADGLDTFADPIPVVKPKEAIDYFLGLVPKLGLDPERYGLRMERHAFTLAVASEKTLLEQVKDKIAAYLQRGGVPRGETGAHLVQDLLDRAGVSPDNPQYAEMVFRTNVHDAYHQGQDSILLEPEMQEEFPVWEYLIVDDERTGDDHQPKGYKYYPAAASFAEVRGNRPYNCRCDKNPVHRDAWARLMMEGKRVETTW